MKSSLRMEIMKKLLKFGKKEGIAFLSEKDALNYYRGLVEIIEQIIKNI